MREPSNADERDRMKRRSILGSLLHFRRRRRVLLLDDDSSIRRLVSFVLGRAGYAVDEVLSGSDALEMLAARHYDAILLDLMMPHEGGVTVIRKLSETDPALLKRIVLLTAAPDAVLEKYGSGIAAVIRKPFDAADLTRAVDRLTEAA